MKELRDEGGRRSGGVFSLLLFMLLISLCSLKSDSSDLSVLWFIEMYCWKCTGQGFLPTPAGSSVLSLSLSVVVSVFPLGLQSCGTGGGSLLFYLLAVGVCACVNAISYAGDAADAGDEDQDDE